MKQALILLILAIALAGGMFCMLSPDQKELRVAAMPAADTAVPAPDAAMSDAPLPDKAVLDISVHSLDELRVLLDRAEQLSSRLLGAQEGASVVLVLHGPEVEFFSRENYDKYKDIVDQAARLDAFDIVDVKICQTMMNIRGMARDDIPAFIDQVPDGRAEVQRLENEGYVYF